MPAAKHLSCSPSMLWAVRAMIGRFLKRGVAADAVCGFVTVYAGYADIHQDEVKLMVGVLEQFDGFIPGTGKTDFDPSSFERC